MKGMLKASLLAAAFASCGSFATLIGPQPDTLDELVRQSEVIVEARVGRLIDNFEFYGYRTTREEVLERTGIPEDEVFKHSVPMSDYEIEVMRLLKGEVRDPLILRVPESPEAIDAPESQEFKSGRRLLFLRANPDNETFGFMGPMFNMVERGGVYMYRDESGFVPAFDFTSEEELLGAIQKIVRGNQQ